MKLSIFKNKWISRPEILIKVYRYLGQQLQNDIEQTIMPTMADQGMSEFCVVFAMSLCTFELKQTLISLLFQAIWL